MPPALFFLPGHGALPDFGRGAAGFVDEDIDHANWIILDHIIVQAIGKEDHLLAVLALYETLHSSPRIAGQSLSDQGVFTQAAPFAEVRLRVIDDGS